MIFGPGRWLHKLFACSIFGNLLFIFLLILVYNITLLESKALVAPDCVRSDGSPLLLCKAPIESELVRISPNTIYVAFDGVHRAVFEFASEDMDALKEITITDNHGRPWISASLEDGRMIYNQYLDNEKTDPEMSLIDKDGDGFPDSMVNWEQGVRYEPDRSLTWHRIDPK